MSDREIYNKVKPITMAFNMPLDPWTETGGKCVDNRYFVEHNNLVIEQADRFIGRTECHKRCKRDHTCAAFSAVHNSKENGECIMLRDGPGIWVGSGPRDPQWHCHMDIERDYDSDTGERMTGNDGTSQALLLDMLEEME